MEDIHICPSLIYAISLLSGDITGFMPSSIIIGSPPENATAHICTFGGIGLKVGFTGRSSSQLEPKSPPLIYTIQLPSDEIETLESS